MQNISRSKSFGKFVLIVQCKFLLETNLDTIYELGNQEKVSMKSDDDKSSLVCRTFERKNRQFPQFPLEKEGKRREKNEKGQNGAKGF